MAEDDSSRHVWRRRRQKIEGKTQYVRVSMSESERARLMMLEQQTGMSPSAILMESLARSADPAAVQVRREQLGELLAMRRLMANIANNVNQIARHANQTGEIAAEAAATLKAARRFGEEAMAKVEEYRL